MVYSDWRAIQADFHVKMMLYYFNISLHLSLVLVSMFLFGFFLAKTQC